MIAHNICPLCSSGKLSIFLKCTDHLLSKEEFPLCKCSECGFIFTNEYPDGHNIGRYYESEDYISHDDNAKGFMNIIYLYARKIMLYRKRNIVEKVTGLKKGRILDIGCGTGYFAGEMKKGGWDVLGIEPNKKARDFGSERFAIDIISPEQISGLSDRSFDCITMWHVMEHLHDPFDIAGQIGRLLKPGGICLTALPNSDSHDAGHYGRFWAAYDVPRHLWHFSPDQLNIFAEKTGFKVSDIRTLPLDVFYISVLSEKNKGTRLAFITGTIKGLKFAVQSLFDKHKSSSLIYILIRK
jgi:SAM-dependent methyltransferase